MDSRQHAGTLANCFSCQNRDSTEWCVLTKDELSRFNGCKVTKEFLPGQVIFHEGDPVSGVYCIEQGLIGFRKTDADGNTTLIALANPGRTMGYRSFLAGEPHSTSAEALKPSRICIIDRSTVRGLLDRNPALGFQFLRTVSRDLGQAEARFHQGVTLSVRARFIHLLLVLKERYAGTDEDGKLVIELPLSRQDLAAMIGTRPETLARTIRALENEGVAHFSGRILRVPDIRALFEDIELERY
ncbi:MAG: Crp/Fnr family transcriptional regulator [Sphingomonadales bacterium]